MAVFTGMKVARIAAMVLALAVATVGSTQTTDAFDVASIRPTAQPSDFNVGLHIYGAQAPFIYLSLRDYISRASRVKVSQIVGPDWLDGEKFDIAARIARWLGVIAGIVLPPSVRDVLEKPWGDLVNNALSKVGLTLASPKSVMEVIVADRIEKNPTEN